MKCLPAFLLLLLVAGRVVCQPSNLIKGKVVKGETHAVIANASVFITNTSKGTTSNNAGEFELTNVPVGTYDLVVSCIGFQTQVYTYKPNQLPLTLQVDMKPKVDELQTVVVEPFEKDGWQNWGIFFTENFIGTSANAKDCSIKNYEVLHFKNSKKNNTLTVVADEPLIIENKALGYSIHYQLEGFTYNFKESSILYFGYAYFQDLNGKPPKSWQLKNRVRAYNGSEQHFMDCLYNDSLAEGGFEVKRLVRRTNSEKERIREIYRTRHINSIPKDSGTYYERVLKQPDMLETYGKNLLTADSLVTVEDADSKQFLFPDLLYIVYKKENEDLEYLQYTHETRKPFFQRSTIFLLNNNALHVDKHGNYYMPQDLMSYGYWSWSEKVANMLPLDYKQ